MSAFDVVKYVAALFSAIYGLYATVNDFHEDHNGQKVLSKKGYVGICLLMISSILSLSTDAWKNSREARLEQARQRKVDENNRNLSGSLHEQLEHTIAITQALEYQRAKTEDVLKGMRQSVALQQVTTKTASAILTQSDRILEPLKALTIWFRFDLRDKSFDAASTVISEQLKLFAALSNAKDPRYQEAGLFDVETSGDGPRQFAIGWNSKLFPSDQALREFVHRLFVNLNFYSSPKEYRKAIHNEQSGLVDLALRPSCKLDVPNLCYNLYYDVGERRFFVTGHVSISSDSTSWSQTNKNILGVRDLLKTYMILHVNGGAGSNALIDGEIKRLQGAFQLVGVAIATPDGFSYESESSALHVLGPGRFGGRTSVIFPDKLTDRSNNLSLPGQ
jgi:hypothetical protein